MKVNPLPEHGGPSVSMVEVCPGECLISNVSLVKTYLVNMHVKLCKVGLFEDDRIDFQLCEQNPEGCMLVKKDIQGLMDQGILQVSSKHKKDEVIVIVSQFDILKPLKINYQCKESVVTPLIIFLPGLIMYESDKVIPWRCNATMLEDGKKVMIEAARSIENIADVNGMTRSGRMFSPAPLRKVDYVSTSKKLCGKDPVMVNQEPMVVGQSNQPKKHEDVEELLRLIKRNDYKVVYQLLQTRPKISVLSLLLNSEARRKSLMNVLEQAYVDHDVTVDYFDGVVGNITACNVLSFSDEELLLKGRKHNYALHSSMRCREDSLFNVLVDMGSSLNVIPKESLYKLDYQGTFMKHIRVMVKAFDGYKRKVIGEVNLPMMIGPEVFQVTFQVMDIYPMYSYLLGRPWIHGVEAVTSTLHPKLKFVKDDKLVIIYGEQTLLVSHLSSFWYIDADEEAVGTQF